MESVAVRASIGASPSPEGTKGLEGVHHGCDMGSFDQSKAQLIPCPQMIVQTLSQPYQDFRH